VTVAGILAVANGGTGNATGTATVNANLTGAVTSVGNATSLGSFTSAQLLAALTNETGTGVAVFGTSPAITTSLTTASTTFALLNTAATTINFGGAATAVNIGAATGTATVNNTTLAAKAITASTTLGVTGVSTLTGGAVIEGLTVGKGGGAIVTNTVVGDSALFNNSTGSGNTAIGYLALINATNSGNAAFGANSGNQITTGSNNVIIGSYTGSAAPISATGNNWIVLSDGAGTVRQAIDPAGNTQFSTGAVVVYAPAPASFAALATLTNANLQTQLIVTTGTAYTLTMPTGSTLDTLISWSGDDLGFDFSIVNTASGTVTMAVNTGVTNIGTLTVLTGISARFRIRRTSVSNYILYRIG
jgi:hypothetical protein